MFEFAGAAKVCTAMLLIFFAAAPSQVQLTRVDAPYMVYQIQLLGRIMYFCPESPDKGVDCGRWVRETAFGATAFVQPSLGGQDYVSVDPNIATH